MRVDLSYGKASLPVEFDERWNVTVIRKRPMPVEPDAPGAVQAALSRPVGAQPLVREAQGAHSACVLICDITRSVPNGLLLPPLLDAFAAGNSLFGIPVEVLHLFTVWILLILGAALVSWRMPRPERRSAQTDGPGDG